MIPEHPEEFVNNSPNAWAPLAYDPKLDIVYVPTGVGTPDIWGGDRSELKSVMQTRCWRLMQQQVKLSEFPDHTSRFVGYGRTVTAIIDGC